MELPNFEQLSIRLRDGKLEVLDQRKLPDEEEWLSANSIEDMCRYIEQLSVRGAPLIGVAAAYSLAVYACQGAGRQQLLEAAGRLRGARPTAVNLMHCCDAVSSAAVAAAAASTGAAGGGGGEEEEDGAAAAAVRRAVCETARAVLEREVLMNDALARLGAALVADGDGILTHCNTGGLATPGKGTALGVIREAFAQSKRIHVYVDETRPLLQGARLTTYELERERIPHTLICDNMAASLMRLGRIQRVFVGADRIAANGDFANKIGTYSLAISCRFHNIPFHVVAPVSTVDLDCPSGDAIPIENRRADEVRGYGAVRWAPAACDVYNPAFDVTPGELVTSIVLDSGVYTQDDIRAGRLRSIQTFASSMKR